MDYPWTSREWHWVLLARVLPPHTWAWWHYSKHNKPFLTFPMFSGFVQYLTLSIASLLSYHTSVVPCKPAHLQCGRTFSRSWDEWLPHKLEGFLWRTPLVTPLASHYCLSILLITEPRCVFLHSETMWAAFFSCKDSLIPWTCESICFSKWCFPKKLQ